jgi:hypothetical protein
MAASPLDVAAIHLVCTNCGGSNTAALVAAIAGAVVALATLGLAVATFISARATRKETGATRDAAKAAAQEASATLALVDLGREQMSQAHLPVVMPLVSGFNYRSAGPQGTLVDVFFPVVNVGLGPALGLRLTMEMLDSAGNPSVGSPPQYTPGALAGLGAGDQRDILVTFRNFAVPLLPFRFDLGFKDTFDNRFRVTGRYFPEEAALRELEFQALDGHGMPVATIAA